MTVCRTIWDLIDPQTVDAFGDCYRTQTPPGSVNTGAAGPNVVDEFGRGSADLIPRRDSGFAPAIQGRFVDTERLELHPGKRDLQRSGESAESRQP